MKSEKFLPRSADQIEEDERLYKNDPGMNIKKERAGKFVPINEIVDPSAEEENEEEEINGEEISSDFYTEEEITEKQKEEKRLKDEIIGIVQGEQGTAHVGPDFAEVKSSENKVVENEELPHSSHIIASPIKQKINSSIYGSLNRKFQKLIRGKIAGGKDNIKTMSHLRDDQDKIRKILHGEENIQH